MVSSGTRLGSFEVVAPLGAGAMGEVWRARDTRLGREVALKLLPDGFASDPDRLGRFEREARLLASLSHPNIAVLHEIEEVDERRILVMELVEGLTLAERVHGGCLPVRESLEVARQLAEALEAAHEKGIVHRDLKPSNVKITPDGRVKVLDFGLARAFGWHDAGDSSLSPTKTADTSAGVVVGTTAYMSPEQARGQPVDGRTDVWALGCVLYEMLTGGRAFPGTSAPDVVAAVLDREPDLAALPTGTPAPVRSLLRRCLQKDKARRLRDVADARLEIEEALGALSSASSPSYGREARSRGIGRQLFASFVVGGLAVGAGGWLWSRADRGRRSPPRRYSVLPEATAPLANMLGRGPKAMALSPSGTQIAYVATLDNRSQIYLRAIDELEGQPVPGTEGAVGPFFSFDGNWLGFAAEGKLKKVPLTGGPPQVLCEASALRGATWGEDDTIIFAPLAPGGLFQVSAAGGTPRPVTTTSGRENHRWPAMLPGGNAALFSTATDSGREEERTVAVVLLGTGKRRTLVEGASDPRFSPTGHLLYARAGSILAAPFDRRRLELTGSAVPVADGVLMDSLGSGLAYYDVADTGALVYVPEYPVLPDRALVWMDRQGKSAPLLAERGREYLGCSLSPEGQRLAVSIIERSKMDVWIYDLVRGTKSRLTIDGGSFDPTWSPDGRDVVFVTRGEGAAAFYSAPADGSRPPAPLAPVRGWLGSGSFSPDGRLFAFNQISPRTGWDIAILPLEGDRTPGPFLATASHESSPAFSPDGRLLAYQSDESGRLEVYVRPYPGPGSKWTISNEGGSDPRWARDGRELFYRSGDKLMAVPVRLHPQFTAGSPRVLFESPQPWVGRHYDVTADGRRFVLVTDLQRNRVPLHFVVARDWYAALAH